MLKKKIRHTKLREKPHKIKNPQQAIIHCEIIIIKKPTICWLAWLTSFLIKKKSDSCIFSAFTTSLRVFAIDWRQRVGIITSCTRRDDDGFSNLLFGTWSSISHSSAVENRSTSFIFDLSSIINLWITFCRKLWIKDPCLFVKNNNALRTKNIRFTVYRETLNRIYYHLRTAKG